MKKWVFILIISVVLFISGCQKAPSVETLECNKPYILFENACCLDNNNNNICDNREKYISDETSSGSDGTTTITCPKEVTFSSTESPSKEIEIKFDVSYSGYIEGSYVTAFSCDDGYTATTNPLQVALEKDQPQVVKSKVTLSPKECTFKLVDKFDIEKIVSCQTSVKAF